MRGIAANRAIRDGGILAGASKTEALEEEWRVMKEYLIWLVPGPVSVPRKIRELWLTDFGSSDLESEFFDLYAENRTLLKKILGTKESVVITSGEAMSVLWGGLKSVLRPGDRLLAVAGGLFGEGFADMARALGFETETVSAEYDSLPDPEKVREAALRFRPRLMTAVHCETPSGTLTPLKPLGEIAGETGALFLVDFVSSGGGVAVDADANHIDIGLLGSQKALSLPPSLAITTLGPRAWEAVEETDYRGYEAYLPWRNVPDVREMPYTHNWQGMAALRASLTSILEEGLENVFARHAKGAALCRKLAREMGIRLYPVSEDICSPTVSAFYVPQGWTWEEFDRALRERGLAVGGNYGPLAGKVFRIGHMGSQADESLIARGMEIVGDVLAR
jgi:aspartate aminotransferase-like enzyme